MKTLASLMALFIAAPQSGAWGLSIALSENAELSRSLGEIAIVRADINKDVWKINNDALEKKGDQALVQSASATYEEAMKQFGALSPDAKTAQAKLDQANSMLRKTLNEVHKDAKGLRFDEQRLIVAKRDLKIANEKIDIDLRKAEIAATINKLGQDNRKNLKDQDEVRQARNAHEEAALVFGMMGPQAQMADFRLVKATSVLHAQRAVVNRDLKRLVMAGKRLNKDQLALNRDEREQRGNWLARLTPYMQ